MSDIHIHLGIGTFPVWVQKGVISMPTFPLVTCAADWHHVCERLTRKCDPAEVGIMPRFTVRYIPRADSSEHHWCLDFPNGYTLSVRQYGYGSYSDDRSVELLAYMNTTANKSWDDIRMYQDLDALISAIAEVSQY